MRLEVRDLLVNILLDYLEPTLDRSKIGVQLVNRHPCGFGKLDPVLDIRNYFETGWIQCRLHRSTTRVATDDDRRHLEHGNGVLNGGRHSLETRVIRGHDVALVRMTNSSPMPVFVTWDGTKRESEQVMNKRSGA